MPAPTNSDTETNPSRAVVVSDACSALDLAMEIREATLNNHALNAFGYRGECTPEQYSRFSARAKEIQQNTELTHPHERQN